jgi:hypothetical protein
MLFTDTRPRNPTECSNFTIHSGLDQTLKSQEEEEEEEEDDKKCRPL